MTTNIPLNIFFYWDTFSPPKEVVDNVNNFRIHNLEYNVVLLNDNDINKYVYDFPELIKLFHLSTIAALKSDIFRLVILYEEGGLWLDANTTLIANNGMNILFDKCKEFDFVITLLPTYRCDLKTSALISKPKSQLAYDSIQFMTSHLLTHYNVEKNNSNYVPYNYFYWIAPVSFFYLLDYKYDDEFRDFVKNTVETINTDVLTLDLPKFTQYKCGLMIIPHYIRFYGCNMSHHHGENVHKHWSNLQKYQRLFRIEHDNDIDTDEIDLYEKDIEDLDIEDLDVEELDLEELDTDAIL